LSAPSNGNGNGSAAEGAWLTGKGRPRDISRGLKGVWEARDGD